MSTYANVYPPIGLTYPAEGGGTITAAGLAVPVPLSDYYAQAVHARYLLESDPTASHPSTEYVPSSSDLTVLNVMNYGARGDGVTDDAQAFRDVIAACITLGGRAVYVPGGMTYFIGSTVVVNGDCEIRGDGQLSSILLSTSQDLTILEINTGLYGGAARHCVVADLGFSGGGVQIHIIGENFFSRTAGFKNINFIGYRRKGLFWEASVPLGTTAGIGTSHHNLNFEAGAAVAADSTYGLYANGAFVLHFSSFYDVRVSGNTGAGIAITDTGPVGNGASVGTVFHMLTCEGNSGHSFYSKSASCILYSPHFENNGRAANDKYDLALDSNYNGAAVDRTRIQCYSASFGNPAVGVPTIGGRYMRIAYLNQGIDLSMYNAYASAPVSIDAQYRYLSTTQLVNPTNIKIYEGADPTSQSSRQGVSAAGFISLNGGTPQSLGLNINEPSYGGAALVLCSKVVAGVSAVSGVYLIAYGPGDNTYIATFIAGTNIATFSQTSGVLFAKATDNTNLAVTIFCSRDDH